MNINLNNFTNKTGYRFKSEGQFSGQWFRDDILYPAITNLKQNQIIILNLDDVQITYNFIDQCFSKLIYNYKINNFSKLFKLQAKNQSIIFDILGCVIGAELITFKQIFTKI